MLFLQIPSGLPRHLEAAVQRYGSTTYKATCMTVLDQNGKLTATLLYGKYLLSELLDLFTTLYSVYVLLCYGEH